MKIFTNNFLKIIAIIFMILDHFAYYFSYLLPANVYVTLRIIGRISMPIFSFLIVEGFCHTKNFNKYLIRVGIFALATQISLFLLDKFMYVYNVQTYYNISSKFNILFSFFISLIALYFIKKVINILFVSKKIKNSKNDIDILKNVLKGIIYVSIVTILSMLFYIFNFDYGIKVYVLIIGMYLINTFCDYLKSKICLNNEVKIDLENNKNGYGLEKDGSIDNKKKINMTNLLSSYIKYSLYICLFWAIFNNIRNYEIFANLALIIIFLYNGKKGKKSRTLKYGFYFVFLLQHILLYILSGILYKLI